MASTPQPAAFAKPAWPILQPGHSLAQGLVGAWLFNDGGAVRDVNETYTIRDFSGNLNDGLSSVNSGNGWHLVWQGGLFGMGGYFQIAGGGAQNTYVDIPTPNARSNSLDNVLKGGQISFGGWARIDANSGSLNLGYLFGKTYDGSAEPLVLRIAGSSSLNVELSSFNVSGFSWSGNPSINNFVNLSACPRWCHIIGVVNLVKGYATLYLDGVRGPSNAISGTLNSSNIGTGAWRIGNSGSSATGRNWQGLIDDILMWNRALTDDDVRALYQDQFAMFRAPSLFKAAAPVGRIPYNPWPQAAPILAT